MTRVGSMGCLFFTGVEVVDFATAKTCDTTTFATFFHAMLREGVYLAPSQFEAYFFSTSHGPKELGSTIKAYRSALQEALG